MYTMHEKGGSHSSVNGGTGGRWATSTLSVTRLSPFIVQKGFVEFSYRSLWLLCFSHMSILDVTIV